MNKLLFKVLRFSGLPFIFREIIQRNKVTIVLFHNINKESATMVFKYLSEKYTVISLKDYIYANENKKSLPKKALIITFDDGHIGNYELLPIIKKHNLPITIFLCSSIINTNRHFWFLHPYKTEVISEVKNKSNEERLVLLSKAGFDQKFEYEYPQALNKKQIDEMKISVDFQSHTMFHPYLPKCNYKVAKDELFLSKEMLEKDFQLEINTISYPNGDYSDREIELAKEANYKCGITVDYGYNTIDSDIFRLKRISVNDTDDINELIVKASGVWAFIKTRNGKVQKYGYTNQVQ